MPALVAGEDAVHGKQSLAESAVGLRCSSSVQCPAAAAAAPAAAAAR